MPLPGVISGREPGIGVRAASSWQPPAEGAGHAWNRGGHRWLDSGLTQASGSLAKVFGWYDNEWGYTCRLADLTAIVGERP